MIDTLNEATTLKAPAVEGSFRDPSGKLFCHEGRILRAVYPAGMEDLGPFLKSAATGRLEASGKLVGSHLLDLEEAGPYTREFPANTRIVAHQPIPFPSYPYEWPAEMLRAAGELTLELAEGLLAEGFGLKDATPFNVLFRGARPVFVDLLSFERRRRGDPVWLAEAQFVRTFLFPLLAARRFGLEAGRWLAARRDGLEPEEVYGWLGRLERLGRPWLTLVTLPTWLGSLRNPDDGRLYQPRQEFDVEKADFILKHLFGRLKRALRKAVPAPEARSGWLAYMDEHTHYSGAEFQIKESFVQGCLDRTRPDWVLDVGSNSGHFSRMAAIRGASVVAIDADSAVTGACWRSAIQEDLDILPLVVDVARPTPAMGWRNRECRSFLERAKGRFDLVMMLAILHHLLVSERIPLEEVLDLASQLSSRYLLIEYVDPSDPMFRRLARGRDPLHADLTPNSFEGACRRRFEVVRKTPLGGCRRVLYLLRKAG